MAFTARDCPNLPLETTGPLYLDEGAHEASHYVAILWPTHCLLRPSPAQNVEMSGICSDFDGCVCHPG